MLEDLIGEVIAFWRILLERSLHVGGSYWEGHILEDLIGEVILYWRILLGR